MTSFTYVSFYRSGSLSDLPSVRDAAKSMLAAMMCRLARTSSTRAGIAVVYHRVGGKGGDSRLEILAAVSGDSFARQLRQLRRHYRLVPASELLDAVRRRRRWQRFPASVTFDDDLAGHLQHALPALERAGVPATFFLGGTSLNGPNRFWWEDLQRAVDDRLVEPDALPHVAAGDVLAALERSPKAIFRVAAAIERLDPPARAETAAALRAAAGPPAADEGLRAAGIKALVGGGAEVGFHTLRHHLLPTLSDAELEEAMSEGRNELAATAGVPLDVISYPHGRADDRVAAAARAAGFKHGFVTARTAVTAETNPLLIPRIPPALSPGKTALRFARAVASSRRR
jgi:peptidoglycan/xylan/chitin deacetylase (PgdA/CDA1 family)